MRERLWHCQTLPPEKFVTYSCREVDTSIAMVKIWIFTAVLKIPLKQYDEQTVTTLIRLPWKSSQGLLPEFPTPWCSKRGSFQLIKYKISINQIFTQFKKPIHWLVLTLGLTLLAKENRSQIYKENIHYKCWPGVKLKSPRFESNKTTATFICKEIKAANAKKRSENSKLKKTTTILICL